MHFYQGIGIENASPESIIKALNKVRTESSNKRDEFGQVDLIRNNLIGNEDASYRRDKIGQILGIGYGNAKQFLSRLNNYGVSREEFVEAVNSIDNTEE
jgi:ribonuclease M5